MARALSLLATATAIAGVISARATTSSGVSAQQPMSTPTPVHATINADRVTGLIGDGARITWDPIAGAERIHLSGTISILGVDPEDPFCTPARAGQSSTISIDVHLAGAATEYAVAFPPPAAGDRWYGWSTQVQLRAFDARGAELVAVGTASVAETVCARAIPSPAPTSVAVLPSTGLHAHDRSMLVPELFALAAGFSGMLGIALGLVRSNARETRRSH